MELSWSERLVAARRANFVGRAAEIALFESAFKAEGPPVAVLFVHGPGGIGKSWLVQQYIALAKAQQALVLHLDLNQLRAAEPEAFLSELAARLPDYDPRQPLQAALRAVHQRAVLVIDSYELVGALDQFLREEFLPTLPSNILCVIAGQRPPSMDWRADAAWQTLMRVIPLHNLADSESRALLTQRGVPPEQHEAVLSFTHSHPLALSLVADTFAQRTGFQFQLDEVPHVVQTLLERLIQPLPSDVHRTALEVCALARITTESLLRAVISEGSAPALFDWLCGLSLIEMTREGIFPHDIAREALTADLRWRKPEQYVELHRRLRAFYLSNLTEGNVNRLLADYVYLHRDNPVIRPFFTWQQLGTLRPTDFDAPDFAVIKQLVTRYEGEESTKWVYYWMKRTPHDFKVWRDGLQLVGYLLTLTLPDAAEIGIERDPAVSAIARYLYHHAPLRGNEIALIFRFWGTADTYQAVSPVQSAIFVEMVRCYLQTPRLAYTFIICADPILWADGMQYADLTRIVGAEFSLGGRRYGVFGHDWRMTPPAVWLNLLAERELGDAGAPQPLPSAPDRMVLTQQDFADAVRDALRDLTMLQLLGQNPLCYTRLIIGRSGSSASESARAAILVSLIQESIAQLGESARHLKAYRALYHTYLQPAPTQEQAAEAADLPFSTYRRHLRIGITWVTEQLWSLELGADEANPTPTRR